jgi:hypothetical protein
MCCHTHKQDGWWGNQFAAVWICGFACVLAAQATVVLFRPHVAAGNKARCWSWVAYACWMFSCMVILIVCYYFVGAPYTPGPYGWWAFTWLPSLLILGILPPFWLHASNAAQHPITDACSPHTGTGSLHHQLQQQQSRDSMAAPSQEHSLSRQQQALGSLAAAATAADVEAGFSHRTGRCSCCCARRQAHMQPRVRRRCCECNGPCCRWVMAYMNVSDMGAGAHMHFL